MNPRDILRRRLQAQHLIAEHFASPHDMVRAFGAVQSQDYPAAEWAVGQRVTGGTDATIDDAYSVNAQVATRSEQTPAQTSRSVYPLPNR